MNFTFIHAADLHIDSPLAALGAKDRAVRDCFEGAGRRSVDNLVAETIRSGAAFLLIAGDIFDGEWRDASTGLFFARALGELDRKGIRTFVIKGNHDADSVVSRSLPLPASTRVFASNKAESVELAEYRTVLHGRSFPDRCVPADFVEGYPQRREGWLNIGLLHTSLEGSSEHAVYAPCGVDDLKRFHYDYWALGHVHDHRIVERDPWIVYPGNVQGRSVRETGAKGVVRVEVKDGRIADVTHVPLDGARWARHAIDLSGCEHLEDVNGRVEAALASLHDQSAGLPLAARLTLTGMTSLHHGLAAGACDVDDIRAIASRFSGDFWIEKIVISTSAPDRPENLETDDVLDVESLIAAAAGEEAFNDELRNAIAEIAGKMPRDLRASLPGDEQFVTALASRARDYLLGNLASGSRS